MEIHLLKGKRMTTNLDGNRVEDQVVGLDGKEWPIKEAADLIFSGRARFYYGDEDVTNLDMLPEC
jgi:hypothetical protein